MWAYVQLGTSATFGSMHYINTTINDPTFHSYLDQLDLSKKVIYGLAILGMITFIAHGHDD